MRKNIICIIREFTYLFIKNYGGDKMSRKIEIILLIMFVVSLLFAAADRGALPGELWIVGPDISLDSTFWWYLYYSSDAGTTLTRIESIAFSLYYDSLDIPSDVASDRYVPGVVYLDYGRHVLMSTDYGTTWEWKNTGLPYGAGVGGVCAGAEPGEVSAYRPGCVSFDFGDTWELMGGPEGTPTWCCGVLPGERYAVVADMLHRSTDYGATWEMVNDSTDFLFLGCGYSPGEIYGVWNGGNPIFCSNNNGSSFYVRNSPDVGHSIFGGWNSEEFFIVSVHEYLDPIYGLPIGGGIILINYSNDFGITFRRGYHWDGRSRWESIVYDNIDELNSDNTSNNSFTITPNPFNNCVKIFGKISGVISIYNIDGVLIDEIEGENTVIWTAKNITSGIYWFVSEDGHKAKAIYLK